MTSGSYDDLPDARVRVELSVPIAPSRPLAVPPFATATVVPGAPAPARPAVPTARPDHRGSPARGRHAARAPGHRRSRPSRPARSHRSPVAEAVLVGLTAAGIVFGVLALLLLLSDRLLS